MDCPAVVLPLEVEWSRLDALDAETDDGPATSVELLELRPVVVWLLAVLELLAVSTPTPGRVHRSAAV